MPGLDFFKVVDFNIFSTLAIARYIYVGLFSVRKAALLVLLNKSLDISRLVSASKALLLPVNRVDSNR